MSLINITIICGGISAERDVSLVSAQNIISSLAPETYKVSMMHIDSMGGWTYYWPADVAANSIADLLASTLGCACTLLPGHATTPWLLTDSSKRIACDCVFPVLHGTQAEDGVIQGVLSLLGVPYVGSKVLGSAVSFAKDITKSLLSHAGIPTVPGVVLTQANLADYAYDSVRELLGDVVFVKPVAQGSSIGVAKVNTAAAYANALAQAFLYDDVVLVERAIVGRELECSVIGNEQLQVTAPGEVVVHSDFYSFDAKYKDASAADIVVPADIDPGIAQTMCDMALTAFHVLRCYGMARVDFFLTAEGNIYLNEVNTIPGFTSTSMFAQNFEVMGVPVSQLLDALIQLARNECVPPFDTQVTAGLDN